MKQPQLAKAEGPVRSRFSVSDGSLVTLFRQLENAPADKGLVSVQADGSSRRLAYRDLFARSARICAGLRQAGVVVGDKLLLQLEDGADVAAMFWGAILAGAVPVPLNPPPLYTRMTSPVSKLIHVWQMLESPRIVTTAALAQPLCAVRELEAAFTPAVLTLEGLCEAEQATDFHTPPPDDMAVLFLTSGSTGLSKGVPQTHAAILAMIDGTIQTCGFSKDDVTLNWMSLDHAGSLVFLGAMAVALGCEQVHVSIAYVLQNPLRWLALIDQYRASISWAPNFAFSLFLEKQDAIAAGNWDLRCMRFMVNAGEAIVSRTARAFIRLLQQHGLPGDALRPAFGMVETNSGITWSNGFTLENSTDEDAFVDLGPCIPGCALRVVDDAGNLLPEGQSGRFQLRGDSVFAGYYRQDALNAELFDDGWMNTGDLAMLRQGHLYITGREKDVIIINGNNFYCHEIEGAVEQVDGIARGHVAACGARLAGRDTEQLVIFFHGPEFVQSASAGLVKAIRACVMDAVGVMPAALVVLQPEDFPRTEIGKIQRAKLRQRFENGDFADAMLAAEPAPQAPRRRASDNALADAIADIWCRVLNVSSVSYDETFFELGGHSLLAFQVQQELEVLIGRPVPIVELFTTPTVRSMAEHFGAEAAPPEKVRGAHRSHAGDTIAVIGLACRFPGADTPEAFWRNLCDGVESITFYEPDAAIRAGLSPADAAHPDHVHAAPYLEHIEDFDAGFWNYASREARMLDPQQRVFLETAWEAFEDAGYRPGTAGRTAVFGAAGTNTYLLNNLLQNQRWLQEENGGRLVTVDSMNGFNVMITNDKDYLPTRVSYKLDLTGPSINVQTACSSTLVAISEAVKSLRSGECDTALAGGCAVMVPQHAGHLYSEGMIMTPDGHCRAYDADARGTIFGSGSGAVLLKRLSDAEADGDHIYAVIKGAAVVNDGGRKMGYTSPSLDGEYAAIRGALDDAGIPAGTLSFVEGHGTGTPLGDPIEVGALSKAFREDTADCQYCALGSVKTNIGHMGIASGIAGALKTILALHHKRIPGTLHYRKANPQIDFEKSPFYVNLQTRDWETDRLPRRAGVNSLGIGGTNAHVIFEEAPVAGQEEDAVAGGAMPEILPLSGQVPGALHGVCDKYAAWMAVNPALALRDVCRTAQLGRMHFPVRRAVAGRSVEALTAALGQTADLAQPVEGAARGVVFVFSGQGAQVIGMGSGLYAADPVFRPAFDACCEAFRPYLDVDLRSVIRGEAGDLNQTGYTQPALFAIQVALVQTLEHHGVFPAAVMGHSIGEYAAAWLAGILSLADAVRLVARRSAGMQALPTGGAMTAVFATLEQIEPVLAASVGKLSLASSNAPASHVISGDAGAMQAAVRTFEDAGIRVKALPVSHAFHSAAMDPMLADFHVAAAAALYAAPALPFFSTCSGKRLESEPIEAAYWVQQLRQPVLFADAMQAAVQKGFRVFLEIGPHPSLALPATQSAGSEAIAWVGCLKRQQPDADTFVQAIGQLYEAGCPIDWEHANAARSGRRIPLPTYAWQRERHWIEPDAAGAVFAIQDAGGCAWLGQVLRVPYNRQTIYSTRFTTQGLPLLADHLVFGLHVPPGALYASQLLQAGAAQFDDAVSVQNLLFLHPMVIEAGAGRDVQVLLQEGDNTGVTGEIVSSRSGRRGKSAVTLHARATLQPAVTAAAVDLAALRSTCSQAIDPAVIAGTMQRMQVALGASFRWIRSVQIAEGQALAQMAIPAEMGPADAASLHPGLIDSCWQVLLAAMPAMAPDCTMIPFCVDDIILHALPGAGPYWCHAVWEPTEDDTQRRRGHVQLLQDDGRVLLETRGLELHRVEPAALQAALEPDADDWILVPAWEPAVVREAPGKGAVCWVTGDPVPDGLSDALRAAGANVAGTATDAAVLVYYADADTSAVAACQALHALIRSWAQHPDPDARLVLYTSSPAADIIGLAPNLAPLHGMATALRHEFPDRRILQLDSDAAPASLARVAALMVSTAAVASDALLIRDGQTLSQVLRPGAGLLAGDGFVPAPDAVQVITGGTGALGLRIAEALIARGAGTIVLAGRHAPSDTAAARIDDWQRDGADVRVVACDTADRASVDALLQTARACGPLQLVLHAAGVREDGFAVNLSDESIQTVLQGKYIGARHLVEALQAQPPQYLVFFSSVAALFGSAGQTSYAAANAGLDALAAACARPDFRVVSINWGPWQEAGMAANLDEAWQERLRGQGYRFMPSDAAIKALFGVLVPTVPARMVIASLALERIANLPGSAGVVRHLVTAAQPEPAQQAAAVAKLPSELAALDGSARKQAHIETYLCSIIGDLLKQGGGASLDPDKGLFDLGMDSLAAVEIKARLERDSGLKLRSTLAFDYPTVRKMAVYLVGELAGAEPESAASATGDDTADYSEDELIKMLEAEMK